MENVPILCELDFGAGRSVLSEEIYKSKLIHCYLSPTNIKLKFYDGSIIKPLGKITVQIKYKNKCCKSEILVMEKGHRPLIGRDLMETLGFQITEVNSMKINEEDKLNSVINQY